MRVKHIKRTLRRNYAHRSARNTLSVSKTKGSNPESTANAHRGIRLASSVDIAADTMLERSAVQRRISPKAKSKAAQKRFTLIFLAISCCNACGSMSSSGWGAHPSKGKWHRSSGQFRLHDRGNQSSLHGSDP